MKKLRISEDYVAVDVVDVNGIILSTPIYIPANKPTPLKWLDREEKKFIDVMCEYDGKEVHCKDEDGFEHTSPLTELLTEVQI